MRIATCLLGLAAAPWLTACNTIDPPLIFGKMDTLGISASATAPDQGGTISLGYRSAKLAIVPVTAHDGQGRLEVLREQRVGQVSGTGAFSTFAHFEASANARAGVGVCLGDTFATGLAAQALAQNLPQVCKVAAQ